MRALAVAAHPAVALLLLAAAGAAAAEPPKEGPALRPVPPPAMIDPNESGTYRSGKWEYRFEVKARGTRAEGRYGQLSHDSKELPEPKAANSAVQTPWGVLYWVGMPKPLWGSHGWMQHPAPGGGSVVLLPDPGEGTAAALHRHIFGGFLNGKTVGMNVAEVAIIELPGEIATGYAWVVTKLDGEAVAQVGKVEYVPGQSEGEPNGPGGFTAIFQAIKPGQATLEMAYRRPTEKDKAPAKTFALTFTVEAAAPAE